MMRVGGKSFSRKNTSLGNCPLSHRNLQKWIFSTMSLFTLLLFLSINIVPFCQRLIFGDVYIIVLSILEMSEHNKNIRD